MRKTTRLLSGLFVLSFALPALWGAAAHGAVVDDPIHPYPSNYHYQLRDVSGSRDGHTIAGAQWFACLYFQNVLLFFHYFFHWNSQFLCYEHLQMFLN